MLSGGQAGPLARGGVRPIPWWRRPPTLALDLDTDPDGLVRTPEVVVRGTTRPFARVALDLDADGRPDHLLRASRNGTFRFKTDIPPGDTEVVVHARVGRIRLPASRLTIRRVLPLPTDTTAPELLLEDPWPANSTAFNGRASDSQSGLSAVEASLDAGPFRPLSLDVEGAFRISTGLDPVSKPGSHRLDVRARDHSGNVSTASILFFLDEEGPELTVARTSDTAELDDTNATFEGLVRDPSGVAALSVIVDSQPARSIAFDAQGRFRWTTPWSLDGTDDCEHRLRFLARDLRGHEVAVDSVYWLDTLGPALWIASTVDPGEAVGENPTWRVVATDSSGVVAVEAKLDDGPYQLLNQATPGGPLFATSLPLDGSADGLHAVTFRAADRLAQASTIERSFVLDTRPPTFQLEQAPADDAVVTDNPIFAGQVADAFGPLRLTVLVDGRWESVVPIEDDGHFSWSPGLPLDGSADRGHIVEFNLRDAAGNTTTSNESFILQGLAATPVSPFTAGNVLVTADEGLQEFSRDGELVRRFLIPKLDISSFHWSYDVVVDSLGRAHVLCSIDGGRTYLSSFDPALGTWTHHDLGSTFLYGKPTNADMEFLGEEIVFSHGILSLQDYQVRPFPGIASASVAEASVGGDGLLYLVTASSPSSTLSVFDPTAGTLLRTVRLGAFGFEAVGFDVAADGRIYAIDPWGILSVLDSDGHVTDSLVTGVLQAFDLDLAADGTIAVSGLFGDVILTDTSLHDPVRFRTTGYDTFATFVP